MGSIIVVVVFPLLESFGEQICVVDDFAFEESVELLGIDPVGPLNFSVQPGCAGSDLDVIDALVQQVPVERLPELLPVVGVHLVDLEWQLREYVVDELDRGLLVVAGICAQYPDASAVIDRGVLVVALLAAGLAEWFDECHVDLQLVAWTLLVIALPPGVRALVSLRGR